MAEEKFSYAVHVQSDWVDYNGHMNDAAYAVVFSHTVDSLMDYIGLNEAGRAEHNYTIFTLETHLCYLKEALEGEELTVEAQLLDSDAKRLHIFFRMKNSRGDLVATSEQMLMGMDTAEGRPAQFPAPVAEAVQKLHRAHEHLETPDQAGRKIGIKRRS